MLELADSWVWDFWLADDGERYHLFFLFASRSLHDPELRHRRAAIGHAVSDDLTNWVRVADALVHSDPPAVDEIATWTGSIVRDDDGLWRMFYTGCSDQGVPGRQAVALAVSDDLMTWTKRGEVAAADPRWYSTGATTGGEPFRDPWVFHHDGDWHMLVTAGDPSAPPGDEGSIGHAVSTDLDEWIVHPPLNAANTGFSQVEVMQLIEIEGDHFLIFNCLATEAAERRRTATPHCAVWVCRAASPLGPFDMDDARVLHESSMYVGRGLRDRQGVWQFLAFENEGPGGFVGRVSDPQPLLPLLAAAYPEAPLSPGRGSIVTVS